MSSTIKRTVRRKASSSSDQLELKLDNGTPTSLPGLAKDNNCERCSNWESAEHVCMWGTGPKNAKIMIIGEAPGDLEDRTGRHFQGRGGKLLDELLEAAGVQRKDCYLTNVVKCHPPEGRSPSAKEVKICKDYLIREIAEVKPEFILTLGATVLKTLTKKAKITEMHGQPFEYMGSTVVPSFHPNMALRDPTRLPGLRKDIVKFGHIMAGNVPSLADIHWEVITTLNQWNVFIEEFAASNEIGADLETSGLDPYAPGAKVNTIQISLDNDKNYALPLNVKDSPWRDNYEQQKFFIDTMVDLAKGKEVIGQNFKFDNRWLYKHYGRKFELKFDVMLAHHLLDENSPHGLKELASEFLNAPSYDIPLRIKLGDFRNPTEREQFYKYGCFDPHYTRNLKRKFKPQLLKHPHLRRLFYKLVMPAARMFEKVESSGHFINLKRQAEVEKELTDKKTALLIEMNKLVGKAFAGDEVNWNSPQQVGKLFYEHLGLPVLEKTAGGAPSTGESVLLRLQDEHPLPKLLMDYRGIDKNLSTYVLGWKELMHGDELFMSTKIHGTVTGRFASRLHQVPRDPLIRSLIDAPPGWSFVCADYSQIELRIAAMLSNDRRMKQIFQTGGDIHVETAAFILGKRADQLTKEERKMAKAVNFGLLYGMGWPKLIIYARDNYGVTMTPQQAQAFRTRYFETYSALPVWHERQRRCVRAFGEVSSLSGRVRHLPGINSSEKGIRAEAERQGINSPVQGFGSGDMKAMAMLEIHEEFSWEHVRIKGEVHDSILMWIRTSRLKRTLPQLKAIMERPALLEDFNINMTVPLVADFEVGPWGNGQVVLFDDGKFAGYKKE